MGEVMTYLLYWIIHDITNRCHRLSLTDTVDTRYGLLFDWRVPLRLEHVHLWRDCEIESISTRVSIYHWRKFSSGNWTHPTAPHEVVIRMTLVVGSWLNWSRICFRLLWGTLPSIRTKRISAPCRARSTMSRVEVQNENTTLLYC